MKDRYQRMAQYKITAKEYREMIFGKLNPKAPGPQFRSEWEREFGLWLTASGYEWKYEAIRLNLADRTTYTPDFWCPKIAGGTFYEVKGFRRQAGMIKFKVAKEQYLEFKFYLVTKNKIGGWCIS